MFAAKASARIWALAFVIAVLFISQAQSAVSGEEKVMKHILTDYNKEVPPKNSTVDKTVVYVSMTLIQIISVNEKREEMATSMYMIYEWYDDRLAYDASQFEGVNVSRIPADDLWVPDIIVQNSKDMEKFRESLRTDVLVYDTGKMEWLPPSLYISSCDIWVELFPFDWQNCSMVFRSVSLTSEELILKARYDAIIADEGAFLQNGEWDLISKPASVAQTSHGGVLYDEVVFTFILRRKPQFYIMNLIVPCILILTFSCFTFYLPAVSGEKMTLSVSTLLGETVFLFLIAQRMPETSRSIPLMGMYLIFSMSLIICCAIFSVIVCNVHFRSSTTHTMPKWIKKYIMGHLANFLQIKRPTPSSPWQIANERRKERLKKLSEKGIRMDRATWRSPSEMLFDSQAKRYGFRQRHVQDSTGFTEVLPNKDGNIDPSAIPATLVPVQKQYKAGVEGVVYIADNVKEQELKAQSCDDWEFCAMVLDRMFFYFYASVLLLGTVAFFVRVALASYPDPDS